MALALPAQAAAQLPYFTTAPPPEHRADPALTTYVFRVGPFSIGGYQTLRRTDLVTPPPVAGSIVGMDVRIVDTSGVEIPQSQLMLHHDVFTNGGADNLRCASGKRIRARPAEPAACGLVADAERALRAPLVAARAGGVSGQRRARLVLAA